MSSDDYETPAWLKDVFRDWFDPCPLGGADNGADGLLVEWVDPTYANVPYSDPSPWVDKAIIEARRGKRVALLVRVDPSTRWWLRMIGAGAHVAFFSGRLAFSADRRPANFASAIVFFPPGPPSAPSPTREAHDA